MHRRAQTDNGLTLVELIIVIAIIGVVAVIAVPAYQGYIERSRLQTAVTDIRALEHAILRHEIRTSALPDRLEDMGGAAPLDPWGNPYQYLRILGGDLRGLGRQRKDRNLVPVNSDFDLYSKGPDGRSRPPFTASHSRDDIVRCRNGEFIGVAADY